MVLGFQLLRRVRLDYDQCESSVATGSGRGSGSGTVVQALGAAVGIQHIWGLALWVFDFFGLK